MKPIQRIKGALGHDEQRKGLPDLEWLTDLAPPEGLRKFRTMRTNDPVIGGLLLQIEGVMRRLQWQVKGDNADFVNAQLEAVGVPKIISEVASSFTYGFYIGELIWKVNNSEVKLVDIEPRFQPSIQAIDVKGNMVEQQANNYAKFPYAKCLHHVVIEDNRSPFGLSPLRHLYKPYYYKVSIEAAESVGADRDLSGLPVLTAPEGFDFTKADSSSPNYNADFADTLDWAIDLVSNVRKDTQQGVVVPFGWNFALVRGDNSSTMETTGIINRLNTEMAIGMLEAFLSIGSSGSSRANMEIYVANFLTACDAFAGSIANSINTHVVSKICDYNNKAAKPIFSFVPARTASLENLASYVARLVSQDVITPTIELEKSLLSIADLPYSSEAKNAIPERA